MKAIIQNCSRRQYWGIILIVFLLLSIWICRNRPDTTAIVAVIGSGDTNHPFSVDAAMKSAQICLENLQKELPDDIRITIKAFELGKTALEAKAVFQKIASLDNTMCVIGHCPKTYSGIANTFFNAKKIPVITTMPNEKPTGNDYLFSLMPEDSFQGKFIANYLDTVLKCKQLIVIHDDSGKELLSGILEASRTLLMTIETKQLDEQNIEKSIDNIVDALIRNNKTPDKTQTMVFAATRFSTALALITSLKYPGIDIPIIAPSHLATHIFIETLKRNSHQESALPGYHSNGLYTISPFMMDMASEKGQSFCKSYIKQFNTKPSWIEAIYYDAAFLAIRGIQNNIKPGNRKIYEERQNIQTFLSQQINQSIAVSGITGELYFDKNKNAIKSIFVGTYENQHLISAETQYQLMQLIPQKNRILKKILDGHLIAIDQTLLKKTKVVYTGVDIIDIYDLNMSDQSYVVDFYLWFRCKEDFVSAINIEFVNAVDPIEIHSDQIKAEKGSISKVLDKKIDNMVTRSYRVKARFQNHFNFQAYPFDKQTLSISFRHQLLTRDDIVFVADALGIAKKSENLTQHTYKALSTWIIQNVLYYQSASSSLSTLGDPDRFSKQQRIQYSHFNVDIHIKRKVFNFWIKNVFLIVILVLVSYLAYFIPPDQFSIRVSLGMSTMLTAAFSHIRLSASFPVGYLLAIEYTYFSVYAIAGMGLLISVLIFSYHKETEKESIEELKKEQLLKRLRLINLSGKILHPAICIILLLFHIVLFVKVQ